MKLLALMTVMVVASIGCAHAQRPAARVYVISESAEGVGSALATGGGGHDCQQEHEECMDRCWKKRYPWPYGEEQSGWYHEKCITLCREQFVECEEEQEQLAREKVKKLNFSRMDRAIEWLKDHKAEVSLGTLVLVGGVSFILATNPAGWLILIPVAAIAS